MKPILNSHYNELQEVASVLTGYDIDSGFSSAKCDDYFELNTKHEKLNYIKELAHNYFNFNLTNEQIYEIYVFVTNDFEYNQNDRFHAFKQLGK